EIEGSYRLYRARGVCPFCAMVAEELADGRRIVVESDNFLAFCPFASRFARETWIVPRAHASHYENLGDEQASELATVLLRVLSKIEASFPQPAYNYIIHTAPFDTSRLEHYHWHIEVIPRVTKTAGFEWGSGCYINSVLPEEAAAQLR